MPTDPDADRIPFRDDLTPTGPTAARSSAAAGGGAAASDSLAALQSAGLIAIRAMRGFLDAAEMALAHPGALAGVVGGLLDTARAVVADVVSAGVAAVASDPAGTPARPDVPVTDVPVTDVPVTDVPVTDVPVTGGLEE